jgi:hypothetical protein
MDCISADGNLFIGYSALLEWKLLKLKFTNILTKSTDKEIEHYKSFKNFTPPEFKFPKLDWIDKSSAINAEWNSLSEPIIIELFNNDGKKIIWECYQPSADCKIQFNNGMTFNGFGYTEKIKMTVKPWVIGIKELRWGRFISEDTYIVWINWIGKNNLTMVFCNGIEYNKAEFDNDKIIFDNKILCIDNWTVIRKGAIKKTIFDRLPWLRKLFPDSIMNMQELKWLSKGIFIDNQINKTGWIIHEVVKWD